MRLISRPLRDLPAGRVFLGLGNLVIVLTLFWWGLHFLLRGEESWATTLSRHASYRGLLGGARCVSRRSTSHLLSSPTVTCMEQLGWSLPLWRGSLQ